MLKEKGEVLKNEREVLCNMVMGLNSRVQVQSLIREVAEMLTKDMEKIARCNGMELRDRDKPAERTGPMEFK